MSVTLHGSHYSRHLRGACAGLCGARRPEPARDAGHRSCAADAAAPENRPRPPPPSFAIARKARPGTGRTVRAPRRECPGASAVASFASSGIRTLARRSIDAGAVTLACIVSQPSWSFAHRSSPPAPAATPAESTASATVAARPRRRLAVQRRGERAQRERGDVVGRRPAAVEPRVERLAAGMRRHRGLRRLGLLCGSWNTYDEPSGRLCEPPAGKKTAHGPKAYAVFNVGKTPATAPARECHVTGSAAAQARRSRSTRRT